MRDDLEKVFDFDKSDFYLIKSDKWFCDEFNIFNFAGKLIKTRAVLQITKRVSAGKRIRQKTRNRKFLIFTIPCLNCLN